jgi:ribosome-associated translation inhibitor RaiA
MDTDQHLAPPILPTVVVRGDVPDAMVAYARSKTVAIADLSRVPILGIEIRLDHHTDPARERPNHVELTIDLDGTPVRAQRSAATMSEAIDRAAERLRRRVEAASERPRARHLRHRDDASWHHGDPSSERPEVYPRPIEERELVRRKTIAMHPESIDEAIFDLESLDHDFFLFVHDETGADAVVSRDHGAYALVQRVPTPEAIERSRADVHPGPPPLRRTPADAIATLDRTNAPFVFFVDVGTGRGLVTYRRYDGHYGIIVPAEGIGSEERT